MMAWIGLGLALILCLFPTVSAQSFCSSDEVYNATSDTCSCNLTMYNSTAMPPNPNVQCSSGQIRINMSKCQLERSGYDSSNVHLSDANCVGVWMKEDTVEIVLLFNTSLSCGNIMTLNESFLTYSNNVTIPGRVYSNGILARNTISFNFSCSYPLQIKAGLEIGIYYKIIDTNIGDELANMIVDMFAYTDPDFLVPYTYATPYLFIDDPLYVGVKIPDLDDALLSVIVTRLYATELNDPYYMPQYDIVSEGCPSNDFRDSLTIKQNGNTAEAQFGLHVFQINGSQMLYLFADVEICNGTCTPVCR